MTQLRKVISKIKGAKKNSRVKNTKALSKVINKVKRELEEVDTVRKFNLLLHDLAELDGEDIKVEIETISK